MLKRGKWGRELGVETYRIDPPISVPNPTGAEHYQHCANT